MTNSTTLKAPKKKGPIRSEAVVPALVFLAIIYAYFYFFFDHHLKRGLELAATTVHGAEVDIGSLHTSFWGASAEMKDLEVTDASQPQRNLFSVGSARFQLLWDALLRAKVVVEDASVLDVAAYTKRRTAGFVLPPPAPGFAAGLLEKAKTQVLSQTRKRFNENFLGDIAEVLNGVDPKEQLNKIKGDLKAPARAEALEKELKAKKEDWEKRIRSLPKPADVKELEAKVKALNFKGNPLEVAKNVQAARSLIADAQAKVNQVTETQKALGNDLTAYTNAIQALPQLAEQDVADLQKRLAIPNIDPKEFTTQLLLGQLDSRLVSVRKYLEVARQYMPPKKTEAQKKAAAAEQIVPRRRGQGHTYTFPITTGYPLFWLRHAAVSSELSQSDWAGKVSGAIKDVSTDPSLTGRPTSLTLGGTFPKQGVQGFQLAASLDHTTDVPKENLRVTVASFPVENLLFADTSSVRLGLKKATGASGFEANLVGEQMNFTVHGDFLQPDFLVEAKSKPVQDILSAALKSMPKLSFGGTAVGTWDNFRFNVDSNLGTELSKGFQQQLQAKLGAAQAQLRTLVNEKLSGPRAQAEKQLKDLMGGPVKELGTSREAMEAALKSAQGAAPAAGKGGLLKGFGF